jgi:hypothetical protein
MVEEASREVQQAGGRENQRPPPLLPAHSGPFPGSSPPGGGVGYLSPQRQRGDGRHLWLCTPKGAPLDHLLDADVDMAVAREGPEAWSRGA